MIRTILFLFLWMIPLLTSAQDQPQKLPPDSSEISIRTIDENLFKELTSGRTFEYNQLPENPDSLWSRIRAWFFDLLGRIFQSQWASVFIRVTFTLIFVAVIIAIINQILGGKLTTTFTGNKSDDSFSLNISEETLHQENYDELLQKALAQKSYEDAVRILYLKALRKLSKANLIQWKADKTNSDYLRELASHPAKSTFSRLTHFYEYVEYGDFRIDENGFERFREIYYTLDVKN